MFSLFPLIFTPSGVFWILFFPRDKFSHNCCYIYRVRYQGHLLHHLDSGCMRSSQPSCLWVSFAIITTYITLTGISNRYPKSIFYVIMDSLEKVYLAGFLFLLLFVSIFPYLQAQSENVVNVCISSDATACPDLHLNFMKTGPKSSVLEFLPLMATSIYCALGLVWSFMRLGFIYLYDETSYQGATQ